MEATSRSVSQLLAYAAGRSNVGGSRWYGNVKSTQELAKNTFDAISNEVAFSAKHRDLRRARATIVRAAKAVRVALPGTMAGVIPIALWATLAGHLGLAIGSFLNVVI